jgi:ABC-type sugar transport system permease subunit
LAGYAFLAPGYVLFLIFVLLPVVATVYYSFTTVRVLAGTWIGLQNYVTIFSDAGIRTAFENTLIYVLLIVPTGLLLALILSFLLHPLSQRVQSFFRAVLYLPSVIGAVVMSIAWIWIYDPIVGPLTYIAHKLGVQNPPVWLGTTTTALPAVALVVLTFTIGQLVIILLAALGQVPEELREAAALDGAGAFQTATRVTLPFIRPVIAFAAAIQTIQVFQLWEVIYILTNGGPNNATTSVVYGIYQQAFQYSNEGVAAAMGVVLLVMTALAVALQFRLWRED